MDFGDLAMKGSKIVDSLVTLVLKKDIDSVGIVSDPSTDELNFRSFVSN